MRALDQEERGKTPWIVMIREHSFYTSTRHLEAALSRLANVIPIHVDLHQWFPGSGPLSRSARFLVTRGGVISIDLRRWVWPLSPSDIDLILVADPVCYGFHFPGYDGPKAFLAIDPQNPAVLRQHEHIVRVADYDYVFCAQRDFVDAYKRMGTDTVRWLPHAADAIYHRPLPGEREIDVAFCGSTHGGRREWLEMLESRQSTKHVPAYLHDLSRVYGSAKIVFNKSWGGEVNLRVFEATACGALLLTDSVENGLSDLFSLGREIIVYQDKQELAELVDYYLADIDARESIARQGLKRCRTDHLYDDRGSRIVATVFRE